MKNILKPIIRMIGGTPKIRENFPHSIEKGAAHLIANPNSWYVEFVLLGPDRRYNPVIIQWSRNDVNRNKKKITTAWTQLKALKDNPKTQISQLASPVTDQISVQLNYAGKTGVCISRHIAFDDERSYQSFMRALDWSEKRGAELVKLARAI